MKVVQIREFIMDRYDQELEVNDFLSRIPAEDVIDVKYQSFIDRDEYGGRNWHSTILIVYKTEKDR